MPITLKIHFPMPAQYYSAHSPISVTLRNL